VVASRGDVGGWDLYLFVRGQMWMGGWWRVYSALRYINGIWWNGYP
jgi:hypothetical protein